MLLELQGQFVFVNLTKTDRNQTLDNNDLDELEPPHSFSRYFANTQRSEQADKLGQKHIT